MKRNHSRLMCALMCVALLFSVMGCGRTVQREVLKEYSIPEFSIPEIDEDNLDDPDNVTSDGNGGNTDGNVSHSSPNVKSAQKQLRQKIKNKGGNLTILCAYNHESYLGQCLVQQYKALCGGTLKFVTAGYGDMQQKLATMHQAGEDPDVYWMTNQDFPSLMYKNILMPLNDKIDFSGAEWDEKRELLNTLSWDGQNYFTPTIEPDGFIFWNRTLFEQAGIPENEMPDALVKANNWTWDTFYNLEKRVANTANGIYGFAQNANFCYSVPASAGEDFVKYGSDGFVSNVKSANFTRAMNQYKKFCDSNYYVPVGSNAMDLFKRSKLAMMHNNALIMQDETLAAMYKDGTIEFTHIPRDPQQKEYIYMGNVGGYAIPIGCKNVDASVAFLEMFQASDYYAAQLKKYDVYERYHLNEKGIKFMQEREKCKVVPCYSLGIKEIQQLCWTAIGRNEGCLNYGSTTWESVAASLDPQINNELNKLG